MSLTAIASEIPPLRNHGSKRRKAESFLLAATLIWGSTFVTQKIGLADASPLFFVGSRFVISSLILVMLFPRKVLSIDRATLQKGGALGILLCVGFAVQTIGLTQTTASKSAFITGMLVVFTPLMQFIIERQFPKAGNIAGVALVAVGLYILTSPEGSDFNLGDGLTLACSILFAIYIVYLDVVSQDADIVQLTFLQVAVSGVLASILAVLFEDIRVTLSPAFLLVLGYLATVATLLTTYVQTKFQRDTTPTRAALIFSLEPVFAAILAYFVLGEVIGVLGVIGGGVIVLGLIVSQLTDRIPLLDRRVVPSHQKGSGPDS